MKKFFLSRFFIIVGLVLLSQLIPVTALAYDVPQKIRVGLDSKFKETGTVQISSTNIVFGYESGGVFRQGGQISDAGGFVVEPAIYYYVNAGQAGSLEQAASYASSYNASGLFALPAYLGDGVWAVYLCFNTEGEAQNASGHGSYVGSSSRSEELLAGGRSAVIFDNASAFPMFGSAEREYIEAGGRKYRGYLEVGRYAGRKLTAVNVIALDDYLNSVVATEMSPNWSAEALKAQAVASRSYMLSKIKTHAGEGYQVCDRPHCQTYLGAGNEAESINNAVRATNGCVIYHNGEPINAVFFSSSGGVTEQASNVWSADVPYLQSVKEVNEMEAKEWFRSYSLGELTNLAAQNNLGVGTVTSVSAVSSPVSGRVTELTFYGSGGTKSLYKEAIRTFFSISSDGTLESRNFTLQNGTVQNVNRTVYISDGNTTSAVEIKGLTALSSEGTAAVLQSFSAADKDSWVTLNSTTIKVTAGGDSIVFVGRGWGHGAGMSQYGAEGMARMGYSFQQILQHYYSGVTVN